MSLPDCVYDFRFENSEATIVGKCTCCNDDIFTGEGHYELEDDVILHDDCLIDYMMKFKKS